MYVKYMRGFGRTGPDLGWVTKRTSFSEQWVWAHISLAGYRLSFPEQYPYFQPAYAEAYIVSPQTPIEHAGPVSFPAADRIKDTQVSMKTSWLEFNLTTNGVGGNAVAVIHGLRPDEADSHDPIHLGFEQENVRLFVTYDEQGLVRGVHEEVQLPGGETRDDGVVRDVVIEQSRVRLLDLGDEASVDLETMLVHPDEVRDGVELRVNPESGRIIVP